MLVTLRGVSELCGEGGAEAPRGGSLGGEGSALWRQVVVPLRKSG